MARRVAQFTCERCGYTGDATNQNLEAEYQVNFGEYATKDPGVLCDDCYEVFWKWAEKNAPELKRQWKD